MKYRTFGFPISWFHLAVFWSSASVFKMGAQSPAPAPAELTVQQSSGNRVQLSWRPVTGFEQLQRINSLGLTNAWQTVTNLPLFASPFLQLEQDVTDDEQFFRVVNGAQPTSLPIIIPDPRGSAPLPPPNTLVSFSDATSFLYTGTHTVQLGVVPGTIVGQRASVLRGRTTQRDGSPLPGVHVAIEGHPEFGFTYSRADGEFDLAVNGGGLLTVDYQRKGFVPAHRQVLAPNQAFRCLADVALVLLDPVAKSITFGTNAPAQLATSSRQTDLAGTRSASVFFPSGTCATLLMPDGSTQGCQGLTIRVTELTVGTNGPAAMPASLPPSSAYTYCAELSADEALAVGASSVVFNQPVAMYVEDFLGFGTGALIPSGYYDRQQGHWVASDNGVVMTIVGVNNGLAQIDLHGGGVPEDAGTLATNLFTTAELAQLASGYAVGTSLVRVPVTHFSSRDNNCAPVMGANPTGNTVGQLPNPSGSSSNGGYGTLRTAQQIFEEAIPLVGTPVSLAYSSARVPDYRVNAQFSLPVIGDTAPTGLQSAKVVTDIGGVQNTTTLTAAPNQSSTVAWDGSWAYGQRWPGVSSVLAHLEVDFDYPLEYSAKEDLGLAVEQVPLFAQYGSLNASVGHVGGIKSEVYTQFTRTLTIPDHRVVGLGGWSLTAQHYYDPIGQILYLGDGTIRKSPPLADAISVAEDFLNQKLLNIAPLSDGSCYLLLNPQNGQPFQIVHWAPNRPIQAVTGAAGAPVMDPFGGVIGSQDPPIPANGYPAQNTALSYAGEIAVGPDDTLYFTCLVGPGGSACIWRIDKQGLLRRVLGGGPWQTFQPDGTDATKALIVNGGPHLAIGPDGTVFFAENPAIQTTNSAWNGRLWGLIRRVGTDGRIYTVAGQGGPSPALFHNDFPGDGDLRDLGFGGPAYAAQLQMPSALCAGRDGSIYWITTSSTTTPFILRVTPSGLLTTGLDGYPQSWDGILNYSAPFNNDGAAVASLPVITLGNVFLGSGLSQGPDGSLYFTSLTRDGQLGANFLWQVTPDGFVRRAGGLWFGSWEGMARDVSLGENYAAAQARVGPDGTLFAAVARNPTFDYTIDHTWQLLRMSTRTPAFSANDIAIAADDASELYVFDQHGHHLRTINTLTGTTNWLFGYDSNNLIITAQDANNLVTTIQRDPTGTPQAIVGPYGQRTSLTLDGHGFLTSVANPAGGMTLLTNSPGGLLLSVTGPRGFNYTASYDDTGRCTGAADPAGRSDTLVGSSSLSSSGNAASFLNVTNTDATGASFTYKSSLLGNGTTLTEIISPLGLTNWEADAANGDVTLTNADGTVFITTRTGDPRFPAHTEVLASATLQLPGGLTAQLSASYAITTNAQTTLANGGWTNLFTFNGNRYTDLYTGSNRTEVAVTPEGRRDTQQFDPQGRPLSESLPGLATTTLGYDAAGRIASIIDQSVQGKRTSTLAYDPKGRLSLLTDPLGRTNAFAYDEVNRVQQLTLADGRMVTYQHDAEGNITAIIPPGRPAHVYSYDSVGQLTNYTLPFVTESDTFSYGYDTQRHLTRAQFPDGQAMLVNWNADGNITNLVLGSGPTLSLAYAGNSGQLTNISASTGEALGWTYQGSLVTGVQWSGSITGSVTVQFNNDLLPASDSIEGTSPIPYGYDRDGLLTTAGPLNLSRDTNGFVYATSLGLIKNLRQVDDLGRLTNYSVTVGDSNFWSVALAFDPLDRITNKVEKVKDTVSRTWHFAYDIDGRLSQVWLNGTLATTYSYDTNGNRLTRNADTATYDAQDRVQTFAGSSFTWSPNGTLRTATGGGQTTTYTYDLRGTLASVDLPGGQTLDYLLDPLGRRIGKKVNGVLQRGWLYDANDRPLAELNANSTVTSRFVYTDTSSTPSFLVAGTNLYALISDERGSVRFVINTADATVAQALDYDEFGRVTADTNPGFQPFGFSGGLYDPDTALVRFGARDYLAETGLWTARDPIGFNGGLFSLYEYAANDPVSRIDPSGMGPNPNLNPNAPVAQLGAIRSVAPGRPVIVILRGNKRILAREFDNLYIGDQIETDPNTVSVIKFYLGGANAAQPGTTVTVIDERRAASPRDNVIDWVKVWSDVSHQKETMQIQTNDGVMGIKG